jgi:predicted  nucleic acid-binding Zn-ribbon protein
MSAASSLWQFEDEKDLLKQSIASLSKEKGEQVVALEKERAELEEERTSHVADLKQMQSLSTALKSREAEVAKGQGEIEELNKQVGELKTQLADLHAQTTEWEQQFAQDKAELQKDADQARNTLIEHDKELAKVKAESSQQVGSLQKELESAKQMLEMDDKEAQQAKEQLLEDRKQLDDLEALVARLRTENEMANKQLDAFSQLKPQLQEAQTEMQSLSTALKSREAEVAKGQGEIEELNKQVGELKTQLADLHAQTTEREQQFAQDNKEAQQAKEQLFKDRKQHDDLEALVTKLRAENEMANMQVEALKRELKVLQNEVRHLHESTDECSVPLAKAAPKQTNRAVPTLPSPSTSAASSGPALDLTRCKQLTRLVKDCVDKDHFAQHHQTIDGEKKELDLTKNKSTIGLSYETLTGEVTGVLLRGPADMTKKIAKGDKIISVDGEPCAGNEGRMEKMLLGSDTPGAITVLRIQNQKTRQVELLKTQL